MSFNLMELEPQKISTDISSYTTFIYGPPKAGKSTFVYDLYGKEALFLRTEKGTKAIAGLMGVDIATWSDLMKALKQLRNPEVKKKYKVIVIDTVDNLYKYLEKYVKTKHGAENLKEVGGGYGQGHAELSDALFEALNAIEREGYTPVFISHASTKIEKIPGTTDTLEKYIPSVPKRGLEIMSKMVDNILFTYLTIDKESGDETRALYTRETLSWQAGSRFKHMKGELPLDAKVYKDELIAAIRAEGKENLKEEKEENYVSTEALDYEELMNEAKALAVKLHKAGRMSEVTSVVEKVFGQGKLLKDAVPGQIEQISVAVDELRSLTTLEV